VPATPLQGFNAGSPIGTKPRRSHLQQKSALANIFGSISQILHRSVSLMSAAIAGSLMTSGRTLPQNVHDLQDRFDMLLLPHRTAQPF
jgi:hypothetical protein